MTKKKPRDTERAQSVHSNVYDYSLVNYTNSKTHITIICAVHGEFQQTPHSHLSGYGCSKCGIIKLNYFYVKGQDVYNRTKFQKHKLRNILQLFDEDLSEHRNMANNGYHKIYDAMDKIIKASGPELHRHLPHG